MTPANDGKVIRLTIPQLTGERRRDLVKQVKKISEEFRVAVRNVRRDALQHLKDALKKKEIAEDEEKRAEEAMQKLTDRHVADIDKLVADKEQELLAV